MTSSELVIGIVTNQTSPLGSDAKTTLGVISRSIDINNFFICVSLNQRANRMITEMSAFNRTYYDPGMQRMAGL